VQPFGGNVTFDLSKLHYLLLAKGPLKPQYKSVLGFELTAHTLKAASSDPVDLSSFSNVDAGASGSTTKWHGSLMVVAWMFLACTGTMTARYGKKIDKQVLGKDIWFRIHQVKRQTLDTTYRHT
jgi:hypothetical protein